MRRFCRWVLPIVFLLPAATAAQADSASGPPAKGTGVTCFGKPATLAASRGHHLLVGTPRSDVIVGSKAADEIRGRGGNDLICGGGGGDLLAGGAGQDRLRGGPGGDFLVGGGGRDECVGNGGANTYSGCEVMPSRAGAGQSPATPRSPEAIDRLPTAAADTLAVDENSGATFADVLSNDTDADGGPKSVESVTQPQHGKVAIGADSAGLTYEPLTGYCNDGEPSDTFTYTLNGGSTATVSVKVACVTTVSADQPLMPSFDPDVTDYATRCTGEPLKVSGRTATGTSVAVNGEDPVSGKFATTVSLAENQEFSFSVTDSSGSHLHYVRCLPSSFPPWEFEKLGQASHDLYVVAPNLELTGSPTQYVVIFDRNGVPVWWYHEPVGTMQDAKVLPDGALAWWNSSTGYVLRETDGAFIQGVTAVGGPTDGHELQQLPNGNFLLISSEPVTDLDLTEFGGAEHETVEEMLVQEISPTGDLEWSWSTKGHIALAETGRWWPTAFSRPEPRDIIHMNAIEPVGEDAVMISVRHTDAIYKIDKVTGNVIWKLGGTWTPKSLKVVNDPEGAYPLGGMHDIRLLPDGTITIHDNNTGLGQPPRAVRYAIDEANKTATFVEQVTDPLAPSSFCCGSARRSEDGSWLMSWGGDSYVAEYDAAHQTNFRLKFGGILFSYRAVPVQDGLLSVSSLRAGMDAMNP
jgi:Arylsulfotransferase (ASST)/Bacterial cadherin-like domain/RTX calcium-binding nonapeptide repeat (4 copies)